MSNRVSNFLVYSALEHDFFPFETCMEVIGTWVLRSKPTNYILACELRKNPIHMFLC